MTEPVRLRKEIAHKARMIATAKNMSLPDYLSDLLGPILDRELRASWQKVMQHKPKEKGADAD